MLMTPREPKQLMERTDCILKHLKQVKWTSTFDELEMAYVYGFHK